MGEHISNESVYRHAPGIPIQSLIESSSTRSHKVVVMLIVSIYLCNDFSIVSPSRIRGEEKTVFSIPYYLRDSPRICCNDRKPKRIGLTEDNTITFISRW